MSKKTKIIIITCLSLFVVVGMVISLLFDRGVLGHKVSYKAEGNVNITKVTDEVNAQISGKLTTGKFSGEYTLEDMDTATTTLDKWQAIKPLFNVGNNSAKIVLEVTVTNNEEKSTLAVDAGVSKDSSNVSVGIKNNKGSQFTLTYGESVVYTVTITVSDVKKDANIDFDVNIKLSQIFDVEHFAYLEFSGEDALTVKHIADDLGPEKVVIPAQVYRESRLLTVLQVEENAFKDNTTMTEVSLPKSLLVINNSAFEGCTNLVNVVIPQNVYRVGDSAFKGCTNLETISFASDVKLTEIGTDAFNGCSKVTTINLPSSVKTIGDGALSGLGITELVLPASIEEMSDKAVENCENLENVYINSSVVAKWENGQSTTGIRETATNVYILKSLVDSGLGSYYNTLTKGEEVTYNGNTYVTYTKAQAE